MAQIQMTEALSGALIVRLQGEYGQLSVANFALDILLDAANAEIARLRTELVTKEQANGALMERVQRTEAQIEDFKRAQDPKRAELMGAADTVKQRQVNGSNPHQ